MRLGSLLLLLGGCNQLLGVHQTHLQDAAFCTLQPNDPTCHDEDGDGVVDSDDNCPTVANPLMNGQQPDFDLDGVGDACDPHPMVAGDTIVEIDTFDDGIGTTWMPASTSWMDAVDAVTSPPGIAGQAKLLHSPLQAHKPTLELHFEVLDLAANNAYSFALHLDFPTSSARCVVGGGSMIVWNNGGGSVTGQTLATGVHYAMRLTRDASGIHCNLNGHNGGNNNDDPDDVVVTPTIEVDNTQVQIDSIVLYAYSGSS